jgi:hypothetical protein
MSQVKNLQEWYAGTL